MKNFNKTLETAIKHIERGFSIELTLAEKLSFKYFLEYNIQIENVAKGKEDIDSIIFNAVDMFLYQYLDFCDIDTNSPHNTPDRVPSFRRKRKHLFGISDDFKDYFKVMRSSYFLL